MVASCKQWGHYLMETWSASLMYTECDPALGEGSGLEDLSSFIPALILEG